MSEHGFDPASWEQRYRDADAHGRRAPDPHLVALAGGLSPGRALEAGCGEGADALWLAEQGWLVTAVDVAPTALARGREHAAALGAEAAGRLDWVTADLDRWVPSAGRYDLVSAHYVHPAGGPVGLVRRLAAAVAPGGTLLVVDHARSDTHAHVHTTADDLTAVLDGERWSVEVDDDLPRQVESPHGGEVTLHDVVLRAVRRPSPGAAPGQVTRRSQSITRG